MEGDVYKYKDLNRVPPLNLGIIAALSEGHDTKIVDEDVDEIKYSPDWDLVGITAATFTSKQAYEISGNFSQLGVKTILGGVHPSLLPEEALEHCDSVVIGEAEPIWKEVLKDLKNGNLKRTYNGGCLMDLDKIPIPRRDLFPKKYFHDAIQITRGCPNHCFYCYLRSVPWGKFRKRGLDRVYEELAQIENKHVFIVDDNLFVDFDYAKKVFDRIAPLKKRWFIQATTTIISDDELLGKMVKSGCYAVAIGFQSVSQDSLDCASIGQNRVSRYKEIVRKLHKFGIMVDGFFMFGFDADDTTIFSNTGEMIKEMDLDDAICYIMTPYPGTELFEKLDRENRIWNRDWSRYSWYNCNFQPQKMSAEELVKGHRQVCSEANEWFRQSLGRRAWRFKRWLFKDPSLSLALWKGYHNWVDAGRLP